MVTEIRRRYWGASGGETGRRRTGHSFSRRLAVLGVAVGLTAAGVWVVGPSTPPAVAAPTEAPAVEGAGDSTYRDTYHFTVPDNWKNDPQRPVYIDGKFNYYYLYNADYDTEIGTAWRLATTTDNVAFQDQGVAAQKKTNANHDLWSGSAVVDTANTAGFGAGAVIMLATQMDHPTPQQIANSNGPQAQFLWYSQDGGRNFHAYGEAPVIPNGGRTDFRDPKVIWDPEASRWVALIAEGNKISFYTSPNLKDWTRVSEFVEPNLGMLECPDLFKMRADDGTEKWVLGLSANGYLTGAPNTYAYWTGSFNGTSFTPETSTPQWLDHGFDWYGAVTWEDPANPTEQRFAMGWMNNWHYAHTTPTWAADGFNGTDSIVRQIKLKKYGTGYSLVSQPTPALADHATSVTNLGNFTVNGNLDLPYRGESYQLEADVSWNEAQNIGLQLRASADGTRHADVGIYDNFSYLNRGPTGNPDSSGTKLESRAPFDPNTNKVHLRILVDRTTIEVFVDDGRYVHSSQVFANPGDDGINLYSSGGAASFTNVTVTEFKNLTQRPARLIADFEGSAWGDGWTGNGHFAAASPSTTSAAGRVGVKTADTFVGPGDPATGSITSPEFVIDRNFLHFQLGGGNHPLGVEPATSVQLLVNGQPIRTATGENSGSLRHVSWDVQELSGQTARFQILDDATGEWGHLMVDQVMLSD